MCMTITCWIFFKISCLKATQEATILGSEGTMVITPPTNVDGVVLETEDEEEEVEEVDDAEEVVEDANDVGAE